MRKEYIRLLLISVINLIVAGVYFGVLDSMGIREKVYSEPLLFVTVGGGLSVFLIIIVLVLYKFLDKKPLLTLGFSFKKHDLLFTVIGSIVVFLCYLLFIKGLEATELVEIEVNPGYISSKGYLILLPFLFGWILAALHEEITNRAYFFKNLQHFRILKMLIVSSLIFALLHFFKGLNIPYLIILFATGFSYMYIYLKSGSVWVGTIIHAFMNFSNSFFFNTEANSKFSAIYLTNIQEDKAYLLYFVFCIALDILLIILTRAFYKKKESLAFDHTLSTE